MSTIYEPGIYGPGYDDFGNPTGEQAVEVLPAVANPKEDVLKMRKRFTMNNAKAAGAMSGIGDVAGSFADVVDPQEDGKSSVTGSALKSAGKLGAVGMSVGGPIGGGVGLGVGALVGILGANKKNKAIDARLEDQKLNEAAAKSTESYRPMVNTQAPIYEDGTPGTAIGEVAEVERDEVVLRKDAQGKFRLIADYRGGKSHAMGGELITLKGEDSSGKNEEGDIVFPKEQRKDIMSFLKSNDHASIESARLHLPEDTGQDVLRKGRKNTNNKSYLDTIIDSRPVNVFNRQADRYDAEQQVIADRALAEKEKGEAVSDRTGLPMSVEHIPERYNAYGPDIVGDELLPIPSVDHTNTNLPTSDKPSFRIPSRSTPIGPGDAPVPSLGNPTPRPKRPVNQDPEYLVPGITDELEVDDWTSPTKPTATIDDTTQYLNEITPDGADKSIGDAIVDGAINNETGITKRQELDMGAALNYVPAAVSMLDSFKPDEKVNRRYVNPKQLEYKDMSEGTRDEIRRNKRIEALAADQNSGGLSQNARARKEVSSAQALDRTKGVNSAEAQRADQVNAVNADRLTAAEQINAQLFNQYEETDAQNAAAGELNRNLAMKLGYEATVVNNRDKQIARQQDIMKAAIGSRSYGLDADGNIINNPTQHVEGVGATSFGKTTSTEVPSAVATGTESTESTDGSGDRVFASGKYQTIPETLQMAVDAGIVGAGDVYDKAAQERVGDWLITSKAGGGKAGEFLKGAATVEQAADALAKEWAGLANAEGVSNYGDGNTASVTRAEIIAALKEAKSSGTLDAIKELIAGAESGGDYDIYNQGTKDDKIISASKNNPHRVSEMKIEELLKHA